MPVLRGHWKLQKAASQKTRKSNGFLKRPASSQRKASGVSKRPTCSQRKKKNSEFKTKHGLQYNWGGAS